MRIVIDLAGRHVGLQLVMWGVRAEINEVASD